MGVTPQNSAMDIETIRTRPRRQPSDSIGIMDISELPTDHVRAVATNEDVYFERRGDRTFLVPV